MTKTKSAEKTAGEKTPEVKPEQPSQAAATVQNPNESQELRAEIERLKKLLASGPSSIEEKISYYQHKQELIKRLQSLTDSSTAIIEHVDKIDNDAEEDVFESEHYKLVLSVKSGYSGEREVLQFRNPVILSELLSFVLGKIEAKRKAIEAEINK